MSETDKTSDSGAPAGARPDPLPATRISRPAPAPRPRGGGSLALAVLLSLIALGGAGYIGWRQWQQEQNRVSDSLTAATLQQRVTALETSLAGVSSERSSINQRLNDAAQVNRSLREELLGQSDRTRNLEDAVAKLAEKSVSGHDTMLLDETESLLRMGGERYTLFHDAQGAAAAYALADQTLAAVNDAAFSGLRQSIGAEREALAKSQPASQDQALQQLTVLRATLPQLPLKPLDTPDAHQPTDTWSRIGHALASVVSVQRDNGAPLAVADARFARELAALDLAQAQSALLAYDNAAYLAALERIGVTLSTQFDSDAASVKQVQSNLHQLAATPPAGGKVQLGAALTELHNLREVHALKPGADSAPASSSSAAKPSGGATP
ncbi:uroporphyrinogen-III C-methyltransferase [Rhodanobacter sp. L36]|uniref:uroporphyrinogen-III C-methyltransferase n=1 Tax=Rhodanobacter sp. L36 TaxID=1747221 RepID=UPI00131D96DC|nr:uroporphyrinogen-III C-methyltransferase [Rhodanobacter sp. L36]